MTISSRKFSTPRSSAPPIHIVHVYVHAFAYTYVCVHVCAYAFNMQQKIILSTVVDTSTL